VQFDLLENRREIAGIGLRLQLAHARVVDQHRPGIERNQLTVGGGRR
jgi:hypothetical protein